MGGQPTMYFMPHYCKSWNPCQLVVCPLFQIQHFQATYRNIVGRNVLRAFGYSVARCCDMLGACFWLKFDHFQTCANNTQHITTRCDTSQKGGQTSATASCAQQCCDCLAGALRRKVMLPPNLTGCTSKLQRRKYFPDFSFTISIQQSSHKKIDLDYNEDKKKLIKGTLTTMFNNSSVTFVSVFF